MPNLRPRPVPHRQLSRETDALVDLLNDAVDTLDDMSRRERSLNAGAAAERDDLESTFPALRGGGR